MSDDSDLLIAAAATAAVFTWVGTRAGRSAPRDWPALLRAIRAGFLRSWRETPAYHVITALRDLLFRRR